ncbi:MAG: sensor histidine kinase [Myxococcota bacterium]
MSTRVLPITNADAILEAGSIDALAGGGELGAMIRSLDWSQTPLGPIEAWPQSLKTSVSLILNSQHPMWIGWGTEMTCLYNDAYIAALSRAKHPWALGRPAAEVWAEVWGICEPLAEKVFKHGEATFVEDVCFFMNRGDFIEETYYSFSYSPIRDESGKVGGLFCPCSETTASVLNARRLRTLSALSANALAQRSIGAACASAADALAKNLDDVPFALLYLASANSDDVHLEQATGPVRVDDVLAPARVSLLSDVNRSAWPIAEVFRTRKSRVVALEHPLHRAERAPVSQAIVLPIMASHAVDTLEGVLIAGVNPARRLDSEYETFYDLIAAQVARAIQNARTVEEEKRRADALAALDRAKTNFFSNVSHEFRTPLTLLLGPTEEALAAEEPALRGENLETVHRNALRLLKLVNTLLDFSKLEAGRAQARYEPVDLSRLTVDLASGFRSAMERGGLRFEVDCPPLSAPAYVDRDMWEKIVLNLLSNALKFTFEGSVEVRLREHEGRAELVVSDTGVGIAEHDVTRLFERFHRIEGARSRTHEGSGIGLALVRDLVSLHGGDIRATSRLGEGTSFTVSIPLGSAHLPAEHLIEARTATQPTLLSAYVQEALRWLPEPGSRRAPAPSSQDAASAPPSRDTYVLVADDNADMRDYVQRLLSARWSVETVNDGAAALTAARRRRPDLILTDVMMPHLDGFGLLKALRNDDTLKTVPIVMLSARAGEEARLQGVESGADDYLVKPFSARELLARVGTQLELGRLRRLAEIERQKLEQANLALERQHREALAAREEAQRANRLKDEFLAMVSHELRTPLNAVLGWATLLRSSSSHHSEQERALATIERNARSLARLVEDILDVSRIISGKLRLNIRSVDVGAIVQASVDVIRPAAEAKQIALSLRVPDGIPNIAGDPDRLQQVVWNLLSNAVRFTPVEGTIELVAFREDSHLTLAVRDSGVGISAEHVPHVFERFRQVDSSTTRRHGGLGLGLAIVRHLVELHGGSVRAESAGPGLGTTFTLSLPIRTPPTPD